MVHGAGSTVGYAAAQIALLRGMRVIATAGPTYAQRLRDLGAEVTSYGDGMAERIGAISAGPVDLVLDTAPVGGALPDLVRVAGGDPGRVLTCGGSVPEAAELGVRDTFHEDRTRPPADALPEFTRLAADGRFSIPIAGTFAVEQWQAAFNSSEGGQARGKLLLLPGGARE